MSFIVHENEKREARYPAGSQVYMEQSTLNQPGLDPHYLLIYSSIL